MTLVLEIEYLSGVSYAAIGPDSEVPDWPPQPDRIFSALVATWVARGQDRQEAGALEWLEHLPAPHVLASGAEHRTDAMVFVPPNDPRSDKQKSAKGVLPALRSRQPRRFPAARPHDRVVRLFWLDAKPGKETLAALQLVARDTAYVGHSASLTRCRFLLEHEAVDLSAARPAERRVYAGRLAELRQTFEAGRRPLPGAHVAPVSAAKRERANVFGERWLLLEHVSGEMPDLRACALVAKALRDSLLCGYRRIGLGDEIPEVVSGHDADGSPSRRPHLAIVPLPFAGFPYADGHAMGFALVPPQGSTILDEENFRKVLRKLAHINEGYGRRVLTLTTKEGTPSDRAFNIGLSPTFERPAGKRSLDPALYTRRARVFATTTPIVLDRHLKEEGAARNEEIATQIAVACRNTDLPTPEAVVADKHSAIEGVPSAYPSGKFPPWMRWRLPPSLASRQLTHAVVRFPEPVDGPVILCAGRFMGLGLCRPLHEEAR
ncbi:MAG: type I-U CRISPR-associated protein Csb2 [Nitrococcus sp.]|nr:type I-U CRISPR-associated protein Csb2 [Nitrococcus sp.]